MNAKFLEPESTNYFVVDLELALNDTKYSAKQHAPGTLTTKDIDAAGCAAVPLELKVLGALRMVCKGCAFDAIAELSGIGKCTQGCGVLFRSVENLLPHSTLPHHVP